MAKLEVLERRDSLPDTELETTVGEHVDHRKVLEQPDRVVQRQADHRWDQLQCCRLTRHCGQEHRRCRRGRQRVAMVLGEVEGMEAARLRALERSDPLLVYLLDGLVALSLDVVEDSELDGHVVAPRSYR